MMGFSVFLITQLTNLILRGAIQYPLMTELSSKVQFLKTSVAPLLALISTFLR